MFPNCVRCLTRDAHKLDPHLHALPSIDTYSYILITGLTCICFTEFYLIFCVIKESKFMRRYVNSK